MNKEYYKQIEEYQKAIDETMSEKMDLEHNWNELKKWLEELIKENNTTIKKCDQIIFKMGNENRKDTHQHKLIDICSREILVFNSVLDKMQSLERGEE